MNIFRNMIGPRLRRIRYERGLTQAALAAMCQRKGWDISRATLAKIECKYRGVADFEIVFFADLLHLPPGELLSDTEGLAKKLISQTNKYYPL